MNPALLALTCLLLFFQNPSSDQGNTVLTASSEIQMEARNNVEPPKLSNGKRALVQFRVSVFNSSRISSSTIEQAEGEARRVFRNVGVEALWLNCPQENSPEAFLSRCSELSFPSHFRVWIHPVSHGLKVSTVGISFMGEDGRGCCAELFYEPIQQLEKDTLVSPSIILGYAMAHELGHLLLGANAHSPTGLMSAHWTPEDLTNATKGRLRFSKQQCLKIRRRLTTPETLQTGGLP